MCGIAGVIVQTNAVSPSVIIDSMLASIGHRGPDGRGTYNAGCLGLGHRRLSVIDLSDDGHQPMSTSENDLTITFNGEIYNYIELKKELGSLGHRFRSRSDTEVILAAYRQWGQACVSRFNGMWAFAIHDRGRNLLFCSRDRFGVKPFYYHNNAQGFFFGSEIRQLLPWCHAITANTELITDFLLTSICDHTDETFFTGIRKLAAGHNLTYQLSDHHYSESRYYELQRDSALQSLQPEAAAELYLERLTDSIKLRLRADVPVGTCLSGGLDSSSVASLASPMFHAVAGKPFTAITAVSEQQSNNEAVYASQVVEHSGLRWLKVCPSYQDFIDELPSVVRTQEEPFGSTSLIMQYAVMKQARQNGIPVLLDGQGGDETLLGYPKYYGSYLASAWREGGLKSFVDSLRAAGRNNSTMNLSKALYFLAGGLIAPARYLVYLAQHRYLADWPAYPQHLSDFARSSRDDFELQKLEITRTNLPVLLRYEDKNSMAHSIETRLPFLDYRLVETALSLPRNCKIRDGWTKWVLRKAMDGRMPAEITWRKNKFGFEAPENLWMSQHLPEMKEVVTRSPLILDLTKRSALERGFERLNLRAQWRLYSLALWERESGVSSWQR
jgi:asparagine synthase (glutamine-hydrolysing)